MATPTKMNLAQKLIEVRKTIPYLQKEAEGYGYKYAKGSVLLALLRPKMDELGILLHYDVINMVTDDVERVTAKGKTVQTGRTRMEFMFTFTDSDTQDQIRVTQWYQGVGDDIQDIGGYHTYAVRYFLLGFFNIPSDKDDPDTFENAANKSRPPELLTDKQIAELQTLINGHDDIRIRILNAYKRIESIKQDQYPLVLATVNKLISDKETTNE